MRERESSIWVVAGTRKKKAMFKRTNEARDQSLPTHDQRSLEGTTFIIIIRSPSHPLASSHTPPLDSLNFPPRLFLSLPGSRIYIHNNMGCIQILKLPRKSRPNLWLARERLTFHLNKCICICAYR